jgi:threonine/homoserine/homoserine lactone efflux protein
MAEGLLIGPLVLFAAAMSFTPGPNVIMVTASAANFGFRPVIPLILGITLGFSSMVVAIGLGLGGLVQSEPQIQALLKYAGGFYLLYLAWRIARSKAHGSVTVQSKPLSVSDAALFQLVNVKGWASALGGVATYASEPGDGLRETSVIATVLTVAVLASVAIWAAFGASIGRFLNSSNRRQVFNWSMAGLLVISLVLVFW